MRNRTDIEIDAGRYPGGDTQWQDAVLEVLLDIRDLLALHSTKNPE